MLNNLIAQAWRYPVMSWALVGVSAYISKHALGAWYY